MNKLSSFLFMVVLAGSHQKDSKRVNVPESAKRKAEERDSGKKKKDGKTYASCKPFTKRHEPGTRFRLVYVL